MRRIVLWLAFAMIVNACQTTEEVAPSDQKELAPTDATKSKKGYSSGQTSDTGVVPVLWETAQGGNVTCNQVGTYAYSSGRINYDEGIFDAPFPVEFTIIVTDGKFVSWSFDGGGVWCLDGISIIVKGSNAANVYTYPADVTSDSGLASPVNASGGPAGLSNLTLCYNLRPCEQEEVCYQDETAWTQGTRYVSKGNWATYTAKNAGTVTLFAGQTLPAGSATLTDNGDNTVTIAITLNAGWSLQDVNEPVKIQGYDIAPTGNPSPGLFTTYKGGELLVTVPGGV